MAWTSPMTAVDNQEVTAALWNQHVRDNFLELAPAKATASGGYFCSTGTNAIAERHTDGEFILTSQSTASVTYVDLATVGPRVTCTTGKKALIFFRCEASNTTSEAAALYSIEISGVLNEDSWQRVIVDGTAATQSNGMYGMYHATNLTPGENTFTMKYRAGSGTASFGNRELLIMPF